MIPEAHAVAVEQGTRSGDDWSDLNRQFPESEAPESDLAAAIWDVLVEYDADVVVDLHESTGIYAGDPVDGVGQAIFHGDSPTEVETAAAAAEFATDQYVDDPALEFETGPFSGPSTEPSGLLVHKATRDLGADSYLVETLSTDVPLETRVQWHLAITEQLVADAVFGSEPDNGHAPDVDGETAAADESDDTPDAEDDEDDEADENVADAPDETPVAEIRTDPDGAADLALEAGQTVTLDATCSTAPAGEIVYYQWDVGATAVFDESGETLEVTAGTNGRDTIVLRVVDDADRTATTSITLSTD